MPDSVYKLIELVGTSEESWEKAAKVAVERAAQSLRHLRVAQVVEQDLAIEDGKVVAHRTKVKVSFKYEGKDRPSRPATTNRTSKRRPARRCLGAATVSGFDDVESFDLPRAV